MLHLVVKPHRNLLRAGTSDAQKLFVLVKVIPAAPLSAVRPPLAVALVIDTSGSMRELSQRAAGGMKLSKLEQAVDATKALLSNPRLVPGDLISIIQFDDVSRVILPLSPLGNGDAAREALAQLKSYSGGTQAAKGLSAARAELGRILQGGVAQRVILLTDGQTFDPEACREAAGQLAQAEVPLVSVGVGEDYNEELLRDLAEIGRGRPYHLAHIEQLEEVFQFEVQSSVREVVTGLRAAVQLVNGVELDSVTRIYPDLAEIDFARAPKGDAARNPPTSLALGNIMAGDYTVFVLELTVSGLARQSGRVRLAQVQLSGAVMAVPNQVESPRHDIVVSFSSESNRAENVDEEVLGYVQQRNVDRLVQGAVRRAGHDVPGARQSLQNAVEMTQRIGNVRVTRLLQASLGELETQGQLSSSMRKTIALETRTRTIKTKAADAPSEMPGEDEIRRLTGA